MRNLTAKCAAVSIVAVFVFAICITGLTPVTAGTNMPSPPKATASVASLGVLLAEFESHVKWEAVDKKWAGRRDGWVAECQRAGRPQKVAGLLMELESNVRWEAVEKKWAGRRDGWVRDCQNSTTIGQVAQLLLEFESNVKWAAVEEKWKARRNHWGREVANAN